MTLPKATKSWSIDSVLRTLGDQARDTGVASAQVFLNEVDDVAKAAADLAPSAAAQAGVAAPSVGRVSKLANSFALTAAPALFAALARDPRVKSILPSQIEDIYPRSRGGSSGLP